MSRLFKELQICGCVCSRIVDGAPVLESGDQKIANQVMQVHIEDEEAWEAADLENHASALKKLIPSSSWNDYKKIQDDAVEDKRKAAYWGPDGPFPFILESIANGDDYETMRAGAVARKKAIDDALPKPAKKKEAIR